MTEQVSTTNSRSKGKGLRRLALPAVALLAAAGVGIAVFQNGLVANPQAQNQTAAAPSSSLPVCSVLGRAELVPAQGALFGVNLDTHAKSLYGYSFDVGHKPAVAVEAMAFPYTDDEKKELLRAVGQVRDYGRTVLLALEPGEGLSGVTEASAHALAEDLAAINNSGVPVIVSFGPDMNGSWSPWGQQPARYISAFKTVAAAVHEKAPGSAMMWAPGYGGGYPFSGNEFEAKPGTAEYAAMDSNGDGSVTADDDPYAPYYPGDEAVDWVGMSLFHWGSEEPWGENEMPEPTKFADQLTGSYVGANGDDSALPDFYQVYGDAHRKPVAVTETAALFTPGGGGADELAIKQAWWGQLFNEQVPVRFPQLKMITWLEFERDEPEAPSKVDWRVTATPPIRDAFVAALPSWLQFGPAGSCRPAE